MSARPICRRCCARRYLGEEHRLLEVPAKPGRPPQFVRCTGTGGAR